MLVVLLVHGVAALAAPLSVRWLGRGALVVVAAVPLGCLGWVIAHWARVVRVHHSWAETMGLGVDLRFDGLAAVLSALILGVGAVVLAYSAGYFPKDHPRLGGFAAGMVAFAGAMFGLVVSDNLLLLYVCWEATTVLSFLLVGHYREQPISRRAALQALLVTAAGGLTMLVGIVLLGQHTGSYLLSDLLARPAPTGPWATVAVTLLLVGAISKSAIVPLHFWLPGAMAAPTPVSAYLHAAAMVKAGIYLVARLAPVFAQNPVWHPLVLTLGVCSLLLAGLRAMQVTDLKLLLAFGTCSQLGMLLVLVGIGTPAAALAGVAVLVTHALGKACLFLVVGIVDNGSGTREVTDLSGLGRRAPLLCAIGALGAASMAGIAPAWGFVAKEAALSAVGEAENLRAPVRWVEFAGLAVGSVLTVAYAAYFLWGAFATKSTTPATQWHPPSKLLLLPPGILALAGVGAGLTAPVIDSLLRPYPQTLSGNRAPNLVLWHGFTPILGVTVGIVLVGLGLFGIKHRFGESWTLLGNADRAYDRTVRALDWLSLRTTATIQRGSLPMNQSFVLGALVLLPGTALLLGMRPPVHLRLWDQPLQASIGLLVITQALCALVMRNRLACVLLVSMTGYGCGLLFAVHGAPDLALTQFLVETLTLVLFVLVLRAFPAEIEPSRAAGHPLPRALLATGVGVAVPVFAAYALSARRSDPIWWRIPGVAAAHGDGKNAVNVLLVDLRAWDTLGETAVLVVAATGVASLVFRTRRFGIAPRLSDAPDHRSELVSWLPAARLVDRRERSMVLQITTRLVFPTIMVLSVFFFCSGHNAPGGGFAGGLTAGLALVLRYLAGGRYELGEALPVEAGHVLGGGLLLTAGTALGSLLVGAPPLSSAVVRVSVPLLGTGKIPTSMLFDLGVYAIVVGLVMDALRSLGAELDDALESQGAL